MIPRVLDTERVVRILGEDDSATNVRLDPKASEVICEYKDEKGAIQRIFNPNIGTYDIYTTTGPSFTTRRIEAVEAMTTMTQANPELWGVIGDQLVKNMDWPGAEEMAERLKLTLIPPVQEMLNKDEGEPEVPPQIKAAMDQMKQTMEQMQASGAELQSENIELKADSKNKADELEIKRVEANTRAYAAITSRLQVVGPLLNPEEVKGLADETKREAMAQPDPGQPAADSMGIPEQPLEQPIEALEPMPESMEPPGLPEPMQPDQPATAGFSLPEQFPQA
jgi:hypothetical protein